MNAPQRTHVATAITEQDTSDVDTDFDRLLHKPQVSARELMLEDSSFAKMLRIAELMASGRATMPKHLQGSVGDCMAIVMQAMRWDMDPFAVGQKTHVVNGALGYEAQLVIAVVENSGAIKGHFHYQHRGDGASLETRCGAMLRGDEEITWGEWLSVGAPKVKNSPLWATNPKQQLSYLQAKNWSRIYCPGAILGVYTPDELEDIEPSARTGPRRKSAAHDAPVTAGERIDGDGVIHNAAGDTKVAEAKPAVQTNAAAAPAAAQAAAPQGTAGSISGGQVAYLRNKLKAADIAEQTICDRFQVTGIELLAAEQFDLVKSELLAMA